MIPICWDKFLFGDEYQMKCERGKMREKERN